MASGNARIYARTRKVLDEIAARTHKPVQKVLEEAVEAYQTQCMREDAARTRSEVLREAEIWTDVVTGEEWDTIIDEREFDV